jgi:ubiquinone/menaquinone biosynthesis C-methylase UbiE
MVIYYMTFERNYFEDGTTGYRGYRDFLCHYVTADKVLEYKPENVLEVGGARGFVCRILQAHDIPATCMDVSVYCSQNKVVDKFVLQDAGVKPYPFDDKKFDLCFSVAVLEHIPEDKIDVAIAEMVRVSKRGMHGITFEKTSQDTDATHCNMHPKEWWVERFAKVDANYKVDIVDKEMLEHGTVDLMKCAPLDGLVKLNIGSFMDMFHYGWVNIDVLDSYFKS